MAKILLIDDDPGLREVLAFALREQGHEVEVQSRGEGGLSVLPVIHPDLVITDLKMPGIDGMEVLRRARESDPSLAVILLTAFGTIEQAVEAMKLGAYNYLTKPYNRDELRLTVEQALERRRLLLENRNLRDRLREQTRTTEMVHASAAMQQILQTLLRIAPTDATVLLTGESGTGKEVAARMLHDHSDRWERPFIAINCGAIPKDLMESELFGYVRGAFTGAVKDKPGKFQQAHGGTLLLDEVGDLPPDLQTKLLRVLETGQVDVVGGQKPVQVDVRLIAATNADLTARVKEGQFRGDLFYRLSVIPVHIPPLRERAEDIPALWDHFIKRYSGAAVVRSTPGLLHALMMRPWPGNARELGNLCQRMVLLRGSDVLSEDDLPRDPDTNGGVGSPASVAASRTAAPSTSGREIDQFLGELPEGSLPLLDVEREVIVRALAKHKGNQTRTAEYLNIPRHVLLYRLEKFEIR